LISEQISKYKIIQISRKKTEKRRNRQEASPGPAQQESHMGGAPVRPRAETKPGQRAGTARHRHAAELHVPSTARHAAARIQTGRAVPAQVPSFAALARHPGFAGRHVARQARVPAPADGDCGRSWRRRWRRPELEKKATAARFRKPCEEVRNRVGGERDRARPPLVRPIREEN
jgi:hypothetical protein